MGYNLRKRSEMAENTSFADPSSVVYRGSQGIEILPGLENHGLYPLKWPEMDENTNFADPSRVVYRRSQGIEILPGSENHGL